MAPNANLAFGIIIPLISLHFLLVLPFLITLNRSSLFLISFTQAFILIAKINSALKYMAETKFINRQEWHTANGTKTPPEPIAIIGMAMRLPGGIHTASDLWKLLVEKRDTRCRVPADRYNIDAFYSKSGRVGTVKSQFGNFLAESDNLQYMDTSFFTMAQAEVEGLDPQQRMLLEVVYECLENGGQTSWRGANIGVYVGVWGGVWKSFRCRLTVSLTIIRIGSTCMQRTFKHPGGMISPGAMILPFPIVAATNLTSEALH